MALSHVRGAALVALALLSGCAHSSLGGGQLDRVKRPAFISRIDTEGGPKARVFREDDRYRPKLDPLRIEGKEADRRLQTKLVKGMTRFEISESLRAKVLALLPKEAPWTRTVDPASVARELQSFLVEEVPANEPDYELLRPLGADAVVEFVIEEYGMRSQDGRAGTYMVGYGRMFFLDGGEVWRRKFKIDQVSSGSAHVDPFAVNKDPTLFRTEMTTLIDAVAVQFAADLNPPDRKGGAPLPAGEEDLNKPDARPGPGESAPPKTAPVLENDLPDPDPVPAPAK
jgi:hypothetical protein